MSTRHSVDLTTARGDAHLAGHGTSRSTSLETTPAILLETSGGTRLAADTVVLRRDGPRQLSDHDDDDDDPRRIPKLLHAPGCNLEEW